MNGASRRVGRYIRSPVSAYSLGDTARILRVSPARLRYWKQTALVEPTHTLASQPAYGFTDLVTLRRERLVQASPCALQSRSSDPRARVE